MGSNAHRSPGNPRAGHGGKPGFNSRSVARRESIASARSPVKVAISRLAASLARTMLACIQKRTFGPNTTDCLSDEEASTREAVVKSVSAVATDSAITADRAGVYGQAIHTPRGTTAI